MQPGPGSRVTTPTAPLPGRQANSSDCPLRMHAGVTETPPLPCPCGGASSDMSGILTHGQGARAGGRKGIAALLPGECRIFMTPLTQAALLRTRTRPPPSFLPEAPRPLRIRTKRPAKPPGECVFPTAAPGSLSRGRGRARRSLRTLLALIDGFPICETPRMPPDGGTITRRKKPPAPHRKRSRRATARRARQGGAATVDVLRPDASICIDGLRLEPARPGCLSGPEKRTTSLAGEMAGAGQCNGPRRSGRSPVWGP